MTPAEISMAQEKDKVGRLALALRRIEMRMRQPRDGRPNAEFEAASKQVRQLVSEALTATGQEQWS